MAIKLFDIQNGEITPTEHCYTIGSLKRIMDEYPEDYKYIYPYLFYMSCLNDEENPFANVPESDKEELILKEVKGNFSPDEEAIFTALETCRELFKTPTYNLYLASKIGVERVGDYIRNTLISGGRDGNEANYLRYLKEFDEVCRSFEARYKAFKEEHNRTGRGGHSIAYDQ